MAWMELERSALAATARASGPDDPTLCHGWSTRHLLAHLVIREQRPLHAAFDILSRREPGNERFLGRLAANAVSHAGYRALIDRFERGAPRWSPSMWAGDRAHLLEYVVHHEDIRRAAAEPAAAREMPAGQLKTIWGYLTATSKLLLRGSPTGIALQTPGRTTREVRKGSLTVTISGDPVELALYLFGRRTVADVEIVGEPEARSRFEAWAD